ncbi:MAG: transcription termination factor NusA [Minisyncoccales bacterium]
MDLKSFASAVNQLSQEKGLAPGKIIESIETALAAAYKKEYGEKSQIIKAKLDPKTGHADFWQVKTVMDDSMIFSEEELEEMKNANENSVEPKAPAAVPAGAMAGEAGEPMEKVKFNPEKHIMIDEAKKDNPGIAVGEEIIIQLEEKQDFGRIAAQTAKQVIIQKIREAEKETIFADFKLKEGEIISGVVQRIEGRSAFMDIGKTTGVLNREEQVPGEFYRPGQRLKAFVLKVEQTSKGPIIFLSRAYPKFVSKLFELEVPEIGSGQVLVKSIAREAGSRTKIAVASMMEGIDPIGAAVGQRGTRVTAVINELGGEKIDIIEYSDDPQRYIINALSPAKIMEVRVLPKNKALAVVPDDQLSLAIGKDGQNVRLAAKLTGWKIDVRSPENLSEALAQAEKDAEEIAIADRAEEKNESAETAVLETAKDGEKNKETKRTKTKKSAPEVKKEKKTAKPAKRTAAKPRKVKKE